MSRRPIPTATKIAEGNRGHRPIEPDSVRPEVGVPEMPKGMSPAARREWRIITEILFTLGVLTVVDGKALAAYCEAFAQSEIALKHLHQHGQVCPVPIVVKDVQIGTRWEKNPSWSIYREAAALMKMFLIEYGLTPASRSRLKLNLKPKEDEFSKFMKRPQTNLGFAPTTPADPGAAPNYVNKGSEKA